MQESLILGLARTIDLVDHQATSPGPLPETSGLTVYHVIGLQPLSHSTPQGRQKYKRGRPETQPWLLRVLVFRSILIELH